MRATLVLTPLILISLMGALNSAPASAAENDSAAATTAAGPASEPVTPVQTCDSKSGRTSRASSFTNRSALTFADSAS